MMEHWFVRGGWRVLGGLSEPGWEIGCCLDPHKFGFNTLSSEESPSSKSINGAKQHSHPSKTSKRTQRRPRTKERAERRPQKGTD